MEGNRERHRSDSDRAGNVFDESNGKLPRSDPNPVRIIYVTDVERLS